MATLILIVLTFFGFLWQFNKWRKQGFKIEKPSVLSFIRCLFFIILSVLPVFIIPKINNVTMKAMTHYTPDYAYGFIGIAVLGVLASLFRLFWKTSARV